MCRVISVVNQKGGCSKTTRDTVNYQIEGKKGKWKSLDSVIIDGKEFYLMEHQEYGNQAQKIILDAYGKMIVEECEMFDANAKRKIREYIWQHNPKNQLRQFKRQGKKRLENYQKYYENGMYERSKESGTEANYNTVDGIVNNQKQEQSNSKTKKRKSVITRLREKQIAIAKKSGKPVPKYLEQEMERKRG